METNSTVYMIGLLLVILYLMTGFDDFVWDLLTLAQRGKYRSQKLDFRKLNDNPPKLLAMAVAAWKEDNVLGDVIDNIIESTDYPKSMYHIFLGVYPNDRATVEVAYELSERHDNVHVVINELEGPTSKAQNINYVIKKLREFEEERSWYFASLTIHDSEDVIHPFELKVTSYLLDSHDALQFPVFPLMKMPRFSNYLENLTTGTYADEFAENHFNTMVSRYTSKAFVPSAGTGFVLSKKTLDSFGEEDVLPKDSLTEDYKLSLTLYQKGIRIYYVLEQVPRIDVRGKLIWDFVTTRSIFPSTFKTAVRQKTRWILGITMQSFEFRDIFRTKGISLIGRYSLYKDLKAKVGNMLVMIGYPILVYFLISLFTSLDPIYPKGSISWYLSLIVTVMMIERQLFRSVAIYNVYGLRSVFFACFFPPLLPIRLIWGNIINMTATFRAYRQKIFGTGKREKRRERKIRTPEKKKLEWAKTDHVFLEKDVLKKYHRTLGDFLMQRGYISPEQLQEGLKNAESKGLKIGQYFVEEGIISEDELLDSLAGVKKIQYVRPEKFESYRLKHFADIFDEKFIRELKVLPLMKMQDGYVVAFSDESLSNAQSILRKTYGISVRAAFLSTGDIERGIETMYSDKRGRMDKISLIEILLNEEIINYEQAIIAKNHMNSGRSENEVLEIMGLLGNEKENCSEKMQAG